MSDKISAENLLNNLMDTFTEKRKPGSFFEGESSNSVNSQFRRLFGRQKPVHHILGGGKLRVFEVFWVTREFSVETEEEKVKLGGSDLKVAKIGIVAWSWAYWNNFERNGTSLAPNQGLTVAQGNVVPIPGAKTAGQAEEFVGALGWRLNDDEIAEMRSMASKIDPVIGFLSIKPESQL